MGASEFHERGRIAPLRPKYRGPPATSQVTFDLPVSSHERLLCALNDVPDGGVREFVMPVSGDPESLLALRAGDAVRVFFNLCPHAGRRLNFAPNRFMVDTGLLICAAHGACFAIPSGQCVSGPCRGESLREVRSEVRDGNIWLNCA